MRNAVRFAPAADLRLCGVQLDQGLVARDPRWHCERSFQVRLAGGTAEIFFIDTNPFIARYQNESWAHHLGAFGA